MLPRTLEPEVMDSAEEARDYDALDHAKVNEAFVDDFLDAVGRTPLVHRFRDRGRPLAVLDCGTGTALIPIALAAYPVPTTITAIDLSEEMLRLAAANVARAGLESRIMLRRADGKRLPFDDGTFDAVMSNSIVHHLPDPMPALAEMIRVLTPGGLLFVRDLFRPDTVEQVESLVAAYTGSANERQQALFRDSLHAALTLDEIGASLVGMGLPASMALQTSDRHWTVAGRPHAASGVRT
ncbi:MAG: class I SAM-dependent methyltransferase [Planctomycetaceae bacterium]